jgi:hypothetical protein
MRLSLKESRMKLPNAIILDRKSGIRGLRKLRRSPNNGLPLLCQVESNRSEGWKRIYR